MTNQLIKQNNKRSIYFSKWILGLVILFLVLIFSSCKEKFNSISIEEIAAIQEANQNSCTDSSWLAFKEIENLITKNKAIPDSIKAENNYALGLYYEKKGDRNRATTYFHNATDYVTEKIKSKRQVYYFYKAWNSYFDQEMYGECLAISDKLISLLDKQKDFAWLAFAYYCDENAYKGMKKYEKALKNNKKRLFNLKKAGDPRKNRPAALISQAEIKYEQKQIEEAYKVLDQLLEKPDTLSNDIQRQLYLNYGVYLYFDKQYEASLEYYKKGVKCIRQLEQSPETKRKLATAFTNMAGSYIELEAYEKAQVYLDSVKQFNINTINTGTKDSYLKYQLSLSVKTNQDIKVLISELDSITAHQKQEYKNKNDTELNALEKAHINGQRLQLENQEKEIKNTKNSFIIALLSILIPLLIIVTFFFTRQRRYKYERQYLQMQQRLLRSQMNPHFIFNFLYAIQNQIKEKPKSAINYLVKFSRLLRLILENSTQDYVQLDKELESLTKYMDLQLLRFPERFTYEIILKDLEEDEVIFIPPMLLQPIVENCIEHGFSNINYQGKIQITLWVKDKFLHSTIEDNGLGIQANQNPEKESSSMHLISSFLKQVTNQKVKLINKKDVSETETGVQVKFLIPYKFSQND